MVQSLRLHRQNALYCVILSRQGEFDGKAEIVGRSGVARRGKQRCICLTIIVGRERQQTAQRIVGHKRHLQRGVATRGGRGAAGDIAGDSSLLTERDVETHVQIVVYTTGAGITGFTRLTVIIGIATFITSALRLLHLTVTARAKEIEVLQFIGETYDPVVGT